MIFTNIMRSLRSQKPGDVPPTLHRVDTHRDLPSADDAVSIGHLCKPPENQPAKKTPRSVLKDLILFAILSAAGALMGNPTEQ